MEKELDKIKRSNFSKLYGPERSTLQDHCKSLATQDGVRDALRSESDAATSAWITSTKHFHKVTRKITHFIRQILFLK